MIPQIYSNNIFIYDKSKRTFPLPSGETETTKRISQMSPR